ncbi:uncharacterized protein LOC124132888 [Haliotis rufescens]|uniref:uncharacterized protein LOC124132888 n=1 Tax=Haliotis rufescens TaxID=6454 RepID=UPI00201F5AFA|nr:uncharacterized protein LOC124132888 [Haliotis rufescens]
MAESHFLKTRSKISYSRQMTENILDHQRVMRSAGDKRMRCHPVITYSDKSSSDGSYGSYDSDNDIKRGRESKSRKLSVVAEKRTDDGHLTFMGPPLKPLDLVEQRVATLNPFMPAVFNFPKVKDSAQAQKLEHTSQNLATELGLTEADRQPPGVQNTKIFLSEETVPLLCVVFCTDKSQADKNRTAADAKDYARSLARELTHKMRDFTDESFNFLCTVVDVAESTKINWTQMSVTLLQENGHLYPYERMTMYQRKFQNLKKSLHFVMSATSVPFYTRNGMPAWSKQDDPDNVPIYQLTQKQLGFMRDLLKKDKPCFITGKPGSGKTVMAVEIARRLNQDGGALLICHDLTLKDKLARMSCLKDIRTCPGDLSQTGCKHIIAVKVPEKDLKKYKAVEPRVPGGKLLVFCN